MYVEIAGIVELGEIDCIDVADFFEFVNVFAGGGGISGKEEKGRTRLTN